MPLFSRRTLADQTNVKVTGSKPDDVDYLTMHKLQDALGDAVAKVLTEKPADPIAAIAKSLTPSRIEENIHVFDFDLGPDDRRRLDALASPDGRSYWDNSDVP